MIEHDVKRLDRLISDISDASRLDAELQRQDACAGRSAPPADDADARSPTKPGSATTSPVEVRFEGARPGRYVLGAGPRFAARPGDLQPAVNAQSFSEPGGKVRIVCRRARTEIEIVVDDDGPGIREDALEKIFERFYTDRPHQGFGQNSGLGLSISKQIVEAHGGRIWAENRAGPGDADGEPTIVGARFVVRLPAP